MVSRNIGAVKRRASRAAQRPRPGMMRVFLALLIIGSAGWYVHSSGTLSAVERTVDRMFMVREISVEGVSGAYRESIMAVAKPEIGRDFTPERKAVLLKSLARIPGLRNIEVAKSGAHTLRVTVREREPVALAMFDSLCGIDCEAVVMPLTKNTHYNVPLISGLGHTAAPGDTVDDARGAIAALNMAQTTQPAIYAALSEINIFGQKNLRLIFSDRKCTAELGPDNLALQFKNLATVLTQQNAPDKGTIVMKYHTIAFLKEEQ